MLPLLPSQRSELQICHLAQEKATLEVQLEEVTQFLRSEREAAHGREQEILEKIAEANSQIANLTSTNTGTCLYHSSIFVLSAQLYILSLPYSFPLPCSFPPPPVFLPPPLPYSFPFPNSHTQCWTVRWWTCVCASSRQTKNWRSCGWRGRQREGCTSPDSWSTCRG